jgi:hypothetical protein
MRPVAVHQGILTEAVMSAPRDTSSGLSGTIGGTRMARTL